MKHNNMTLEAVNSFEPTTLPTGSRDASVQRHAKNTTQLPELQGIGNLTDWKTRYTEIQLFPSSCLDSYFDLVTRGNPVPLLPSVSDAAQYPASAAHIALYSKHQTDQLHQRCRKLEIETTQGTETALHKLYLAAGFVVYLSNGETKRAPIVLIPVSLERMRGRASHFALRYLTGKPLRINPHIADMCSTHIEPIIEPFKDANDLREYLRGIETKVHKDFSCKISANTGIISLQADLLTDVSKEEQVHIELDRTKPGAEFKPLPATSEAFDPQLAIRILRFIEPEYLRTTLKNFTGQTDTSSQPVEDVDPDLDSDTLEKYHNCAGWLIDIGLGHWQLKNIASLPRRVMAMESSINQLLASKEFTRNIRDEYQTVDILHRLNKAKDKILNAPPEMQHHSFSLHADSKTRLLLQQAKIQASALEDEMNFIQNTFHQSAIPSSSTLERMIEIIAQRDDEPQLTNPEYFRARRCLNEILGYNNGVLTENDLALLNRLTKSLRFAQTFHKDPYYKRHFGSLFKGTDTNWQRLDSVVNFNHSLAHELGSSLLVAQLTDRWVSFERDFSSIASNIETAASGAHKLCSLIPMFIDHNTRLENASRVAEKFRCRVDQWQRYLHRHYADTELTPFQLLSQLELGDHSYPTVSLPQVEIDERVYRYIVGHGLSGESVSTTSHWLINVVTELGTDIPTVRRFLDREATLHSNFT